MLLKKSHQLTIVPAVAPDYALLHALVVVKVNVKGVVRGIVLEAATQHALPVAVSNVQQVVDKVAQTVVLRCVAVIVRQNAKALAFWDVLENVLPFVREIVPERAKEAASILVMAGAKEVAA